MDGAGEGASHGEQGAPQPIAIVGYACRLPGQVTSPSDLWELCTRARSGWSPIPKDRFSVEAFHHPNPSKVGFFNPKGGYFLDEGIARFDAPFFNLTVQEATSMDPQQRLLLECAIARRNVGVFAGGNFSDYELNNVRDVETIPMHQATGCAASLESNRISYFFDLRGPSITVDTACSSSLVALHYAVQSLRNGESKEALVAGCRLSLVPDIWVSMSMSQLFNDEGKTFPFDERAKSGFARGDGAGVAVTPKTISTLLRPDASYILIGGTGGLGRSIAKWMSSKGAKNTVLVSRRAAIDDKVRALIDTLTPLGVRIVVKVCDVTSQESVEALVNEEMKDLPPICGVIHGAMVLRDMLFENMSLEDFTAVARSKVEGAWNLHNTLMNSPLDFFIALSSMAGIIGNRGQAAYSAANAFLDGFIEHRKSLGLPGTSIDLTAVSDVGYLADTDFQRRQEAMKNIGGQTIDESEVLALIAAGLTGDLDQSCSGHCITGLRLDSLENNFWAQDARFSVLYHAAKGTLGSSSQHDGPSVPLHVTFSAASSKEGASRVCYEALAAKLAQVLVLSLEDMDPSIPVVSLGLASLVAIEIRNWITREANANVQVLELLSGGSLMALAEIILNKSQAYMHAELEDDNMGRCGSIRAIVFI
ncbi:hypothetical protein PENFLA_c001G04022 [Penicillium flavigenum]|uniref:Uncharacterized protein n=1 Tax=Penicillium flavigenum TaxID=254877 RepID=A0A1V6U479_9EURO|nr:hypothetical protein PENFLA_c001G04022 [Penicillium flavigenum]